MSPPTHTLAEMHIRVEHLGAILGSIHPIIGRCDLCWPSPHRQIPDYPVSGWLTTKPAIRKLLYSTSCCRTRACMLPSQLLA